MENPAALILIEIVLLVLVVAFQVRISWLHSLDMTQLRMAVMLSADFALYRTVKLPNKLSRQDS
jgi:hypothetical protein